MYVKHRIMFISRCDHRRPRSVRQMDVAELQAVLADEDLRETVQLVDVREPWEQQEAHLPGFTLLPLSR